MAGTAADLVQAQMRYAYETDGWHPSLVHVVESVTPEQAAWRPAQGGHSIWELVHHLAYSKRQAAARLRGERSGWDDAEAWVATPAAPDAAAWAAEVAALKAAHAGWAAAVAALDGAVWARGPADKDLDQVLQLTLHDAWHGGQIAVLRRLQGLETLM